MDIAKMQGLERGTHFRLTSPQDKETPNAIIFFNESIVYLKDLFLYPSDAEFDSLGSLELTDAFIDEANQVALKGKDVLKSRIRYKIDDWGLTPKLLMTCNPAKNWTYRQFYLPNREKEIPPYRVFIQSLLDDNPHISPKYREALLTLNKNSRERLLYGNWEYDDDPSTLISYDAIKDYFRPTHIKPEGEKFITIDVARKGKDKTVFRVWHGLLVIYREAIPASTLDYVIERARALQGRFGVPLSHVLADEDGIGSGVVDWLGCKGFVNNASPMKEMIGTEWVTPNYRNLKSLCGYKMAELIEKRQVGELCEDEDVMTIVSEEMEYVKQKDIDKDGKIELIGKDHTKELLGRSPDDWDSIMMRYYFELQPKVFTF